MGHPAFPCGRPQPQNEDAMIYGSIPEGLTFDDVLLLPRKSAVLPADTDTRTCFTRKLPLNIPLASPPTHTHEIKTKNKPARQPESRATRLTGILTNRDLRFEKNHNQLVSSVMTKDHLVTVPVGTTLDEAERLLQKHRIEKLLVVDQDFNLKGIITVQDIQKKIEYPRAPNDETGQLRVA